MRRSPLALITVVLALGGLTACSDDAEEKAAPAPTAAGSAPAGAEPTVSLDAPEGTSGALKPEPTGPAVGVGSTAEVQPDGVGPFVVGEPQADLVETGLLGTPADAAGCTTAVGTGRFAKPEVFLAQGKVVMVKATKEDPRIGRPLTEVQEEFSDGKAVTGAGGAQGWEIAEDGHALLFSATGGTVTAVIGGVTASVEKHFTSGSGC